jgi:hypothetical protein
MPVTYPTQTTPVNNSQTVDSTAAALISAGIDGSSVAHFIKTDGSGNVQVGGTIAVGVTATITGTPTFSVSDGTHSAAISNAPAGTEYGVITRNIPYGNQSVIGTGTAGTPATGVITVQGIASGTPQPIVGTGTAGVSGTAVLTVQGIASGTPQPVSGTVSITGNPVLGAGTNAIGSTTIGGFVAGNNFGYARGILIPGTISSTYVIATAAHANFTAATPSYNATVAQGISSAGGGTVVLLPVDNVAAITLNLNASQIYPIYFTQINSTSLTDLTVYV